MLVAVLHLDIVAPHSRFARQLDIPLVVALRVTPYIGKNWLTDKVNGLAFHQVPDVKANVTKAIGDANWKRLLDLRDHKIKRVNDTELGSIIVLNQCNVDGGCGPTALLMLKLNAEFVGACLFDDKTDTNSWFGPNWRATSKQQPGAISECYGEDPIPKFKEVAKTAKPQ